MKRAILFYLTSLLLLSSTDVIAGDPFYHDQRSRLVNKSQQILINHGLCVNENDCRIKKFIFAGGSTGGIYLEVYGISNLSVIEEIIDASIDEYGRNNKKVGVSVEFYRGEHEESEGVAGLFTNPFMELYLSKEE